MPKSQMDYSHTIIYKIFCKDVSINDIYVGHTTNFIQRKHRHKINCYNKKSNNHNQYVYKFIRENGGWDNWEMIHLEEYNCANRRESEMRERYWIETLAASLNCISPFTTKEEKQEQKKIWYEENKDHILEKAKEHYEANKEQKLEYQKQYSVENKEKIIEQKKIYSEKNKEKISEKQKLYREEHKEEIKEKMSKWREANKEKIKEKIKEKRGELINCDCGKQYTVANKLRHLETKIHTDYQNKICGIIPEPIQEISEEEKIKILRQKQKQKEYREKNTEKLKEQKKIYNDTHKKENSEARKKYYDSHKNQIIEKEKIYAEENKDKIKERKSEWYEKNKEKILQKQKEVFICECGSEVRCAGKAEHLRSTKHKNYIENAQQNNNIQNTQLDV